MYKTKIKVRLMKINKHKLLALSVMFLAMAIVPIQAAASAPPHPYASALRNFFAGAEGQTKAWLADINSDGSPEMLAVKYGPAEGTWREHKYRFFYIHGGALQTRDWTEGLAMETFGCALYFSKTNHLVLEGVSEMGVEYHIFSLTSGVLNEPTKFYAGYDGNFDGHIYRLNGSEIAKTEYDSLRVQYGIQNNSNARPDQTSEILAMTLLSPSPAGNSTPRITMTLNGRPVESEAPPYIENGRTMVPVRFVSEALGAKVDWDNANKLVTVTSGNGTVIKMTVGNTNMAIVNSVKAKIIVMDVPATIKGGRTYVPVRYIGEALGLEVGWNAGTHTVTLREDGHTAQEPSNGSPPTQNPPAASTPVPTVASETAWKQAFYDYFSGSHTPISIYGKYELVDIGGDAPIIYYYVNPAMDENVYAYRGIAELYYFNKGKVNKLDIFEGNWYIKGERKIKTYGLHLGVNVYVLEAGDLVLKDSFYYDRSEKTFSWNRKVVTEDEYSRLMNEAFDESKAVKTEETLSIKELLLLLQQ